MPSIGNLSAKMAVDSSKWNQGLASSVVSSKNWQRQTKQIFDSTMTSAERYQREITKLNLLHRQGRLDALTFSRAMGQVNAKYMAGATAAAAMAPRRAGLGAALAGAASGVGAKVVAGGLGGAAAARATAKGMNFANAFQSEMNQSLAIMDDVSAEMRAKMEKTAHDVAFNTRYFAAEAAQGYYYLASAGLDAKRSMDALPSVSRYAQAGMFDLATATDLATDAQSALGMTVDDPIKNLENLTRVTDSLVKANTLANASVQQFSEALTNKAGAAAKMVGKDIEETLAVLAAFAKQGTKGQEGGTAFNIVFRDLQTKAIENADAFRRLGVSVYDSAGEMRHTADIVRDLEIALSGLSDKASKTKLLELGFTDKSVAYTQMLLGNSAQIREWDEQLRQAGGATGAVADKQRTQLSKGWHEFKAMTGEVATEAFTPINNWLGRRLSELAHGGKYMFAPPREATGAFAALGEGVFGAMREDLGFGKKEPESAKGESTAERTARELREAAQHMRDVKFADEMKKINEQIRHFGAAKDAISATTPLDELIFAGVSEDRLKKYEERLAQLDALQEEQRRMAERAERDRAVADFAGRHMTDFEQWFGEAGKIAQLVGDGLDVKVASRAMMENTQRLVGPQDDASYLVRDMLAPAMERFSAEAYNAIYRAQADDDGQQEVVGKIAESNRLLRMIDVGLRRLRNAVEDQEKEGILN